MLSRRGGLVSSVGADLVEVTLLEKEFPVDQA